MKFKCRPRQLYEAAKRVMAQTVSRTDKGNIAIQTEADKIVVFRNTPERYAECCVSATIIESGKCVAANLNPLSFIQESREFLVRETSIQVGGVVIPLSGSDQDFYTRLQSAGDFMKFPEDAYKVAWVTSLAKDTKDTGGYRTNNQLLFFDNDVVGMYINGVIFSFYKLDSQIFETPVAIPAEYACRGSQVSVGNGGSLWIRDGDFSTRIQPYEAQSMVKKFYDMTIAMPTVASIQITPTLKNALEQSAGFNNDNVCLAYTGGDSLVIESIETEWGFMCERKPAIIAGGEFALVFNAPALLRVIHNMSRISIIYNEVDGDRRYAISATSMDGKMTNILMESRITYQFKYKEI